VRYSQKLRQNTKTPYYGGSVSFKVIGLDTIKPKKLVTSAVYDKQYVCAYLKLFACSTSQ